MNHPYPSPTNTISNRNNRNSHTPAPPSNSDAVQEQNETQSRVTNEFLRTKDESEAYSSASKDSCVTQPLAKAVPKPRGRRLIASKTGLLLPNASTALEKRGSLLNINRLERSPCIPSTLFDFPVNFTRLSASLPLYALISHVPMAEINLLLPFKNSCIPKQPSRKSVSAG